MQICDFKTLDLKDNETKTDSPFECKKDCKEIFVYKNTWKVHMLEEHMDAIKILLKIHSRFLQPALDNQSCICQTRHLDINRFLDNYQDL